MYLIRIAGLASNIKKYLEALKLFSYLDALEKVEPVAKPAKYSRLYFFSQANNENI